eukprot:17128_6
MIVKIKGQEKDLSVRIPLAPREKVYEMEVEEFQDEEEIRNVVDDVFIFRPTEFEETNKFIQSMVEYGEIENCAELYQKGILITGRHASGKSFVS